MLIPWKKLSSDVLTSLMEEFITREGTEYGRTEKSLESKVAQVRNQLQSGDAVILFDPETQTCNIVTARDAESGCR